MAPAKTPKFFPESQPSSREELVFGMMPHQEPLVEHPARPRIDGHCLTETLLCISPSRLLWFITRRVMESGVNPQNIYFYLFNKSLPVEAYQEKLALFIGDVHKNITPSRLTQPVIPLAIPAFLSPNLTPLEGDTCKILQVYYRAHLMAIEMRPHVEPNTLLFLHFYETNIETLKELVAFYIEKPFSNLLPSQVHCTFILCQPLLNRVKIMGELSGTGAPNEHYIDTLASIAYAGRAFSSLSSYLLSPIFTPPPPPPPSLFSPQLKP